jgi:hypothetical protein
MEPVEVAGTILVALPLPPVEPVDPVSPDELPVPEALVPAPLVGVEPPVAEVGLTGVAVVVVGADPVPVALVGAVLAGVDDPVPVPVASGSVAVLPALPSVLGVPAGVEVTGVAVGSVGSSTLEVPVGYSVLSWSGSSRSVSGIPKAGFLAPDRERRWPVRVEDPVEASGLEAALVVGAAEVVAGAAAVGLTLGLDAGVAAAWLAPGRGVRAGVRATTRWWWTRCGGGGAMCCSSMAPPAVTTAAASRVTTWPVPASAPMPTAAPEPASPPAAPVAAAVAPPPAIAVELAAAPPPPPMPRTLATTPIGPSAGTNAAS